jgi:hypothetical protein
MTILLSFFWVGVFLFWAIGMLVHRSRVVKARISCIDEVSEQVAMQYYSLEYFYPTAVYEYEVQGKRYTGNITSRNRFKYRECSLAFDGSKRENSAFPWRSLSVGDEVDVNVRLITPKLSYVSKWYNKRAQRELKVLSVIVWFILPLLVVSFYVQNF